MRFTSSKLHQLLRITLPIVALGLLVPAVSEAGYKGSLPLRWLAANEVDFFMGSVRNSPDARQYADVSVTDNTFAWFFAVDSTGRQASCTTNDPNRIAVARQVTNSSYVRFAWNAQGQCTRVTVGGGSYYDLPVR